MFEISYVCLKTFSVIHRFFQFFEKNVFVEIDPLVEKLQMFV